MASGGHNRSRCVVITAAGHRCTNKPMAGKDACGTHLRKREPKKRETPISITRMRAGLAKLDLSQPYVCDLEEIGRWAAAVRNGEILETKMSPTGETEDIPAKMSDRLAAAQLELKVAELRGMATDGADQDLPDRLAATLKAS